MRTISSGSAHRCAPIGCSGVAVARSSLLLGQRQAARCRARPPARRRAIPAAELLAVEGRALEQVGELLAVGHVVERGCSSHGRVSTSGRASAPRRRRSYSIASSACAGHQEADAAAAAPRRGGRAGPPCGRGSAPAFTGADGKPRSSITAAIGIETFIVSGLPQASATASRNAAGEQRRAARSRRARRPARGSARRAGRAAGAPGGRSPGSLPPAAWIAARDLARRPRRARRRRRPAPAPRSSSRAHSSAVPRMTGPQPRIPAATAPCSDPGSAASVIRAATFVGIIPCSAIATSSRSRK